MFCSKCGILLEQEESFCSNCGTEVSMFCSKCGILLEEDEAFCSNCGTMIVNNNEATDDQSNKNEENVFDSEVEDSGQYRYQNNKTEQKKRSRNYWIFFIVAIFIFGYFATSNNQSETKDNIAVATPRQERIERGFSAWDGSHRGLERLIKKTMNDPDSYDHVETSYTDKGEYLIVKTTFRGKNAFGGVVKNWVAAKADLDGNIIEIISQGQ